MKKMLSLLCAAAMLVAFGAGCKSNDKELKVATNAEFAPWEELDKDGNVVGADADIVKLVMEKAGLKYKFENMEFEGVVGSVQSGACDMAASGLTINPARAKMVDFSEPYHKEYQVLITKTGDTLFTGTTKADLDEQLKGKRIGVCSGFTGEAYVKGDEDWEFSGIANADMKIFDNVTLAIQDLKNDKIDVIVMDSIVAKKAAAKDENKNDVKVIDVKLTVEDYAIAVKKGNTELLEKINKAIKELNEAGELEKVLKNWEIV